MTLLPIRPRQVLVRTEASQLCYTTIGRVLGLSTQADPRPFIHGHGGVGIVEAVGEAVRRVEVGARVVVNVVPSCSRCYGCVTGRRRCQFFEPPAPFAVTSDGAQVFAGAGGGAFAEAMVAIEDYVAPIVTKVPPAELALLSCVAGCGLGMADTVVDRGADVVVFGAGPVGISAIQGARILGAAHIIAIEPIRGRRDLARQLGATDVFDPAAESDLITKVREACRGTGLLFGAGVPPNQMKGADAIIEAFGYPYRKPAREEGADPIRTLQEIWRLSSDGTQLYTCGFGFPEDATITLDAFAFADAPWDSTVAIHHSTTNGGSRPLRDIPRNVRLIEQGEFNAKAMVVTASLDQIRDAGNDVINRTTPCAAVMVLNRG